MIAIVLQPAQAYLQWMGKVADGWFGFFPFWFFFFPFFAQLLANLVFQGLGPDF